MNTSALENRPGLGAVLHTAPANISVYHVARLMALRKISAVIVVNGLRPIGIVTDRDLAVRVIAQGLDPKTASLNRAMTSPLFTISQEQTQEQALEMMDRYGVRQLPVVDSAGQLVALMTREGVSQARIRTIHSTDEHSPVINTMVKRCQLRRTLYVLRTWLAGNKLAFELKVAMVALAVLIAFVIIQQAQLPKNVDPRQYEPKDVQHRQQSNP
ncbi:MAG: CBS domain-containing protein [Nitrospiraceae bacterium]|nr:CBS domain-containing protein [Nitrospiraceae bacterium]